MARRRNDGVESGDKPGPRRAQLGDDLRATGGEAMTKTKIPWADYVFNPVIGCTPAGEGCRNCYACRLHTMRHKAYLLTEAAPKSEGRWKMPKQYAKPFNKVQCLPERLDAPLHVKNPSLIFVCSMSDPFHDDVPEDFFRRIWDAMRCCKRGHTYMLLTKRPNNMLRLLKNAAEWPCIWLGVSVWDQASADAAIPLLLSTPAAVRFASYEPALGPVNFKRYLSGVKTGPRADGFPCRCDALDWIIAGGETGPGARPCDTAWLRSAHDQCKNAGVPFFFKAWGDSSMYIRNAKNSGPRRVAECREWPARATTF